MLSLPKVTLCAIDTRTPGLALEAMRRSQQGVQYAAAVLLLEDPGPWRAQAAAIGVELVAIPEIESLKAYSELILRDLAAWIPSEFALIVQWDGFVLDPSCWTDEFCDYDYIGAPWPDQPADRAVGNGGFSLRSKRLIRAMSDPAMTLSHPEDVSICHVNRSRLESEHAIRFAPLELAARFSFERIPPTAPTFGFHGAFNLPAVMAAQDVSAIVASMTSRMARNPDARDLALALVEAGQYRTARRLFVKWMRARSHVAEALAWWIRTWLYALKRRLTGRR